LAFAVTAKPLHELSNKEIAKLEHSRRAERKTPESRIFRGLGYGAAGASGGLSGFVATVAPELIAEADVANLASKLKLSEQHSSPFFQRSGLFDSPSVARAKLEAAKKVKARVAAKTTLGRMAMGTLGGVAAGTAAAYGLNRLYRTLGDRRMSREMKRRGMSSKGEP